MIILPGNNKNLLQILILYYKFYPITTNPIPITANLPPITANIPPITTNKKMNK